MAYTDEEEVFHRVGVDFHRIPRQVLDYREIPHSPTQLAPQLQEQFEMYLRLQVELE